MNNQAQQVYLRTQATTASPGDLTLMLYNGCIKFMKQAHDAIEENNFEAKNINIKKAQDIIDELLITLNHGYPIAKNLEALYVYIKEQLQQANFKLQAESLTIAIELITELRDTWIEALKLVKKR